MRAHVRNGSESAVAACPRRVRSTPMCGRLRVGKDFLHLCRLVGAPMCSACCAVHTTAGHNALRGSVPIKFPHSTMLGGSWVVLIAGSTGSAVRAVRPPNLHITPGVRRDLVTPQVRWVPCSAHPWP